MKRALPATVVMLAIAGSALAGKDKLQPGIVGEDNRTVVDNSAPPWTAIGHVNISGYRKHGICTGTLLAPGIVLTAAHCVIDPVKKEPFPSKDIHFVAGVNRDKSAGHSVARCVKFPDGFQYTGPERILPDLPVQTVTIEAFKRDLAIVVLAKPLPKAGTIAISGDGASRPGTALIHAAYPADRRFVLSADNTCKTIDRRDGLLATNCDSHAGSSGGPVLVDDGGTMKLVAIMAGSFRKNEATIAVPLSEWPNLPVNAPCP